MMRNWRRHVYLLVNNFKRATYPMRRIDASSLFPSNTAATACSIEPEESSSLSPLHHATTTAAGARWTSSRCLAQARIRASLLELTFLYELDQRAVHKPICLNEPKMWNTISVAAGNALYVLDDKLHPGGFEALRYEPRARDSSPFPPSPDWRWHCLPPPPYVLEPGYAPTSISAYTVVDDSEIWISTPGLGTYSFKIASSLWRKAGDWELPFRGRADYFPEYNLWLGFSSQDSMLCSSNLKAASVQSGPELLNKDWEDLHTHEGWISRRSFLVHLGFGKFCVARFFQTVENKASEAGDIHSQIDNFAVLTGLMLHHGGVNGDLRMIRHRSQLYRFRAMTSGWVF